ncbi:hemolysin family protein [Actinomycetospora cinnamomea]|uniref:CBS domain containing-hemolysin-like protein n=1 Tax=Actinomycetospora cinnamomea TaxID=663609 RepID=A0A2U1FM53_9PSEU|nr:hemolysin family protein [Actinomycetospora cinnamomea]PVZ13268.1 CBS domain containing-hemolysin-like protein [Actinomycetospora cinnamomea]
MIEALLILAAVLLVGACGVFVAAEFAFVGVDRASIEREAEHDRRARGVLSALRSLSTQLSAAQLGITVTNLAIGFLAEPAIARLISGPLTDLGLSGGAASAVSLTIALALSTAITMIFGELVPKNLAISEPVRTSKAVQGAMRAFTTVTRPLVLLLNNSSNVVVRAVGVQPTEELASARSPEELFSLVRRSADQGTLPGETATLVQRTLAFTERHAADVMTPRGATETLAPGDTVTTLLERAAATGHSRFPVLGEPDDRAEPGVVQVRDALGLAEADRAGTTVAELARPVEVVPETVDLDRLLTLLRGGEAQLALVVDEYGDLAGLVTLEDLVEEIVGDVRDEHDPSAPPGQHLGDGAWRCDGRLRPDEASALLGWSLPESPEYDTLAGLLAEHLGRVPDEGDTVTVTATRAGDELGDVEERAVRLTVETVERWRVAAVRLELLPAEEVSA